MDDIVDLICSCDTQPSAIGGVHNEFIFQVVLTTSFQFTVPEALLSSSPDEASLADESAFAWYGGMTTKK